jgi:hypothetical protein
MGVGVGEGVFADYRLFSTAAPGDGDQRVCDGNLSRVGIVVPVGRNRGAVRGDAGNMDPAPSGRHAFVATDFFHRRAAGIAAGAAAAYGARAAGGPRAGGSRGPFRCGACSHTSRGTGGYSCCTTSDSDC